MGRRIWKAVKIALVSALILVLALTAAGLGYRMHARREVAKATAIDPMKGVDEAFFTKIGGIDQFVTIRGQDRDNPLLLILHGGPGFALSVAPRDLLFNWTKDFTLVHWDQRGAGHTFGRSGPLDPAVTIDRLVLDGIEVAEFLRRKTRDPKIVLLGLSWGSNLGVRMVRARPELFAAYVGTGQVVTQQTLPQLTYEELLNAKEDEPGMPSAPEMLSMVLFKSNAGWQDLRDYARGVTDSQNHFRDAADATDLPALGTDFRVPFFVFQGALDRVTPVEPVQAYVDAITAPQKQLVIIPNAGHNVVATQSDVFLNLLVERVRPLAVP